MMILITSVMRILFLMIALSFGALGHHFGRILGSHEPLGHPRDAQGEPRGALGGAGGSLGVPGVSLGLPGWSLGGPWGSLGGPWGVLGSSWGALGEPLRRPRAPAGVHKAIFEIIGKHLFSLHI